MPSNHLILCRPLLVPFSSCLQSFPASRSFPMSQFFTSGGQSIGVSASVLPMNIQDWLHLGWTLYLKQINLFKKLKKKKTKKERRCLQPWTWHREPGLKIFPQGTSPAPSAGTPKAKPGTPTGCCPLRKPVTLPAPQSGPIWHWLLCLLLPALILWRQLTLMKVTWENCGV